MSFITATYRFLKLDCGHDTESATDLWLANRPPLESQLTLEAKAGRGTKIVVRYGTRCLRVDHTSFAREPTDDSNSSLSCPHCKS